MDGRAFAQRIVSLILGGDRRKRPIPAVFLGLVSTLMSMSTPAHAGGSSERFLVPQRASVAPAGFSGVCAKYKWACAQSGQASVSSDAIIRLAKRVNTQVNRQTKEIEDWKQYGKEDYWTLPTSRGGDCEDFVLAKKKLLVSQGVPSETLLIATVLDRKLNSHAVLVLRTKKGDLILDNLTNRVLSWRGTGYTFLKLQNPKALDTWQVVLAGGVIKDGSIGSD